MNTSPGDGIRGARWAEFMLRLALAGAVLAHIVGCYDPSVRDCAIACESAKECAGGQVCGGDGFCVAPSYRGRCNHDAPADADADGKMPKNDAARDGSVDASSAAGLCQLGCTNGTCDAQGVCVIDCSADGACSTGDVVCPTNLPCRVMCGDHACTHKVQCAMATSCDVRCTGTSSCGDVIQCGHGPCSATCSGDSSCTRHTECGMACSCDVACTGSDACGELSKCPMGPSCVLGRGCASALPGCEVCP